MHIKKKLTAVLAVVCVAAAAIYGSTFEMTGASEDKTGFSLFGKKDTIYFWYSDADMTDYINAAAVAFGEERGVRVIPQLASGNEYLETINQQSLHSEQIPDAYLISNESLEKAYLSGLAGEVQDTAGICNKEYFPEAALSAVTYQDKLVAYPFYFETSALIYNETYLEEWAQQQARKELTGIEGGEGEDTPQEVEVDETALAQKKEEYMAGAIPFTVDDILHIGDTFDVPQGVEGIMKWDVSDIFYNYWIVGNYMIVGGDPGDKEQEININNEETIQCLEVYKALNQFFYIEPDTVNYESVIQDFIEGKVVFTIATTDAVKRLEDAKADGSFVYDYGIAQMPNVSEQLASRSLSVTNAVAVNGYSHQKELANEFAAFLTQKYTNTLYERTGKVAASLREDAENGALQIFKAEYASSVPLPKMIETSNFWIQLEILFSKVWKGEDVPTLVQNLSDQIQIQTGNEMVPEEVPPQP